MTKADREQTVIPGAIVALRLLILTGCRVSEILHLRWQDVDIDRRCLWLPESKTGKRIVHLSAAALGVLADVEKEEGNPWVIQGARKGRHLVNLALPWKRLRTEAELDDVRLHDLRHTYASIGAGAGFSLPIIGKMLGHTQAATTQRYAHLAADPVREAVDEVGARVATLLG